MGTRLIEMITNQLKPCRNNTRNLHETRFAAKLPKLNMHKLGGSVLGMGHEQWDSACTLGRMSCLGPCWPGQFYSCSIKHESLLGIQRFACMLSCTRRSVSGARFIGLCRLSCTTHSCVFANVSITFIDFCVCVLSHLFWNPFTGLSAFTPDVSAGAIREEIKQELFFFFFFAPPSPRGACLSFVCEKGSAVSFPCRP